MKLKFLTCLLLLSSVSSILFAQKTKLGGVDIPKEYSFNNKSLVLNGSAVREKFFFEIYVGSLYLQTKNNNAKEIILSQDDMGFRIKVVSSLLTTKKMQAGIKESFDKVSKKYPLSPLVLSKFFITINEKIVKGDEFFFGYNKTNGLMIYKNSKLISTIKDYSLKKTLFAAWLDNAVSVSFSRDFLNGN